MHCHFLHKCIAISLLLPFRIRPFISFAFNEHLRLNEQETRMLCLWLWLNYAGKYCTVLSFTFHLFIQSSIDWYRLTTSYASPPVLVVRWDQPLSLAPWWKVLQSFVPGHVIKPHYCFFLPKRCDWYPIVMKLKSFQQGEMGSSRRNVLFPKL